MKKINAAVVAFAALALLVPLAAPVASAFAASPVATPVAYLRHQAMHTVTVALDHGKTKVYGVYYVADGTTYVAAATVLQALGDLGIKGTWDHSTGAISLTTNRYHGVSAPVLRKGNGFSLRINGHLVATWSQPGIPLSVVQEVLKGCNVYSEYFDHWFVDKGQNGQPVGLWEITPPAASSTPASTKAASTKTGSVAAEKHAFSQMVWKQEYGDKPFTAKGPVITVKNDLATLLGDIGASQSLTLPYAPYNPRSWADVYTLTSLPYRDVPAVRLLGTQLNLTLGITYMQNYNLLQGPWAPASAHTYGVNRPITKAMAAWLLVRLWTPPSWVDTFLNGGTAQSPMAWANAHGLFVDTGNASTMTVSEFYNFAHNVLRHMPSHTFIPTVSGWTYWPGIPAMQKDYGPHSISQYGIGWTRLSLNGSAMAMQYEWNGHAKLPFAQGGTTTVGGHSVAFDIVKGNAASPRLCSWALSYMAGGGGTPAIGFIAIRLQDGYSVWVTWRGKGSTATGYYVYPAGQTPSYSLLLGRQVKGSMSYSQSSAFSADLKGFLNWLYTAPAPMNPSMIMVPKVWEAK